MSAMEDSQGSGLLAHEYNALFRRQWAPWIGGLLLGLLNVLMFAYAKPWGVADGVQNWGQWVLKGFGMFEGDLASPIQYTTSVTNLSLVLGAMIAALLSGEFALRLSYGRDVLRAVLGGVLLGIGAVLGIGCTIGGFFSSFSALSVAGPVMMLGLGIGAYLGLRILLWDLGREAPRTPPAAGKKSAFAALRPYQPQIGIVLLVLVVLLLIWDDTEFTTAGITGQRSILALLGIALGVVNQRTRFCFVRAFREPFMTGEASMTKAAALALMVGVVGFSIIKGSDLSDMRDVETFVNPSVWLGSLSGGIIFGIGMVLTGGCASGSLWRAGEGQVKLWIVLAAFALSSAISAQVISTYNLRDIWGDESYFLPDVTGWPMALVLMLGIALLWVVFSSWNEKTEKVVIT